MRYYLVAAFVYCIFSANVYGQKYTLLADGGLFSSSSIRVNDFWNRHNLFRGGVQLRYNKNEAHSFSGGLYFLTQGQSYFYSGFMGWSAEHEERGRHHHYLTLTLYYNYHFGKNRRWIMNTGIYSGQLLGKTDFSRDNPDLPKNKEGNPDFVNTMGISLGINYTLWKTEKHAVSLGYKNFLPIYTYTSGRGYSPRGASPIDQYVFIASLFSFQYAYTIFK